jgi:hypothetical protein
MSEFRFACPNCGQRFSGDAGYRGAQITCPTCQQPLTVPQIRKAAPIRPAAAAEEKTSALAVASLVCSLFLSLGCIPGIICGHLAKARLRRDIFLTGNRMATAGLVISYFFLFFSIALITLSVFVLAPRQGRQITAKQAGANTPAVLQTRLVDEVKIGDPVSEAEHGVQGRNSQWGAFNGKNWRHAVGGGSFSYVMKVDPVRPMILYCTYWGNDSSPGRLFDILVSDKVIATQKLDFNDPGHFFDVEYAIPQKLTRGRSVVTVTFQARPMMYAGGVFGCQMLKR